MFRKSALLILLLSFVALVGKGWHWAKDGFSMGRLGLPLEGVDVSRLGFEVVSALNQNYRYLGRGRQCYAFESMDDGYVLKLPRHDRYILPFWLRACRFSFFNTARVELFFDKRKRLSFLLTSFQIAYQELKEETALLYLHLKQTTSLPKIAIADRLGRLYSIDLNKTAFVLQKKTPLMMPLFQQSLRSGDREQAQEILNSLLKVIVTRSKKGIFNKDPSFMKNFGVGGVQIDIGSFYRKAGFDVSEAFVPSFLETAGHVQRWLLQADPEMAAWFENRAKTIIDNELAAKDSKTSFIAGSP